MQKKADGQNYAPKGVTKPVCGPDEFPVGIIGLDHGHIYGMCNGLREAGARISLVWDKDPAKMDAFLKKFPQATGASCASQVLEDRHIKLIASAAIPYQRCEIGIQAMEHGKDFFADKPPFTTKEQVRLARAATEETQRKYSVYYSERLHVEAAVYAENLVNQGAVGKVVQIMSWGPHRASVKQRPDWFFDKKFYGGILVDIGCHQIEQILTYSGASSAEIASSRTVNFNHPGWPEFEDFGEASMICDNGASGYFRVDWFTPDGLCAWGDGRTIILGTDGYIEIRKYLDLAADTEGDHVFLANHEGEYHFKAAGACGFPFFGRFIRDCLDRTENAMTQEHAFTAIELALDAQEKARRTTSLLK